MAHKELKEYIVEQLEDSKVEDIIIIDTSKISSLADWVIIGNGRSGKHIESTMDSLKLKMKDNEIYEGGMISGVANDGWIIYDLGNIIIHLFVPAVREIYKLEQLFNPKLKIEVKETVVKTSTVKDKKTVVAKTKRKTGEKKSVAKTFKVTKSKKPVIKKKK